jgi:phosphoenolpyruvate-protein kinase (PTS system EI component)
VREVQAELTAAGVRFDPAIPLDARWRSRPRRLIAGTLEKEVDSLSLGTNDLVQYVLAADREDEGVASYYQSPHPGVLHSCTPSRRRRGARRATSRSVGRWGARHRLMNGPEA